MRPHLRYPIKEHKGFLLLWRQHFIAICEQRL